MQEESSEQSSVVVNSSAESSATNQDLINAVTGSQVVNRDDEISTTQENENENDTEERSSSNQEDDTVETDVESSVSTEADESGEQESESQKEVRPRAASYSRTAKSFTKPTVVDKSNQESDNSEPEADPQTDSNNIIISETIEKKSFLPLIHIGKVVEQIIKDEAVIKNDLIFINKNHLFVNGEILFKAIKNSYLAIYMLLD